MTSVQLMLGAVIGLLMVYFSFSAAQFSQLPSDQRNLTKLLFPFGEGPTAESLHQDGVKQYRAGHYRAAVKAFGRSLERQPANVKGIFLLAGSLARLGRYERALDVLDRAETVDSDFSRIYIKRAYLQLGLGRYDDARKNAHRYVNQDGVSPGNKVYGYLVKLAVVKLNSPRPEKASHELMDSVRKLNRPESSFSLALYRMLNGDVSLNKLLRDELTHGERTEARTWGAIRLLVEDRIQAARRHARWVLDQGTQQRYEYDLARALTSVRGIGMTTK